MDTIRKKERRDWFYSYNMIFEQLISEHAKLIYLYLCRCADADGQSFPSHNTIGSKCSISRRTVINALEELEEIGLLSKENRRSKYGGKTSNNYIISDTPIHHVDIPCAGDAHTHVQEMHIPCAGDAHTHVQEMHIPCAGDAHEGLPSKGLPSKGLSSQVSQSAKEGGQDGRTLQAYIDIIHDNIHYTDLVTVHPIDDRLLDEIVLIMTDVLMSNSKTIRIDGEDKPRELVKGVLMKLSYEHIEYTLERFKTYGKPIGRKKQFLLTTLFNSCMEVDAHVTNQYAVNMQDDGQLYIR